jgi:hypothetical protein
VKRVDDKVLRAERRMLLQHIVESPDLVPVWVQCSGRRVSTRLYVNKERKAYEHSRHKDEDGSRELLISRILEAESLEQANDLRKERQQTP